MSDDPPLRFPAEDPDLQPEKPPSPRVLRTLRQLEHPEIVLICTRPGGWGALIQLNARKPYVERVPQSRIKHMVERNYIDDKRNSAFSALGWIEYETTYEATQMLRFMR